MRNVLYVIALVILLVLLFVLGAASLYTSDQLDKRNPCLQTPANTTRLTMATVEWCWSHENK